MKTSALKGWGMAGAFALTIAWFTSYDAALADAGKTGRPILLDFYTDW